MASPYAGGAAAPQQQPQQPAQPAKPTGVLRIDLKKCVNVPGDSTFFTINPFVVFKVGQQEQASCVCIGKNPEWGTTPQAPAQHFEFELFADSESLLIQVWEKATTPLGNTHVKTQATISLKEFKQGKVDQAAFTLPHNCTVVFDAIIVDEQTSRTIELHNLRQGTEEQHLKELYAAAQDGIQTVYLDKAKNTAWMTFNTKAGYISSWRISQQYPDLQAKPATTTAQKAETTVTPTDFKNDPAGATKKLVGNITGKLFGK